MMPKRFPRMRSSVVVRKLIFMLGKGALYNASIL
jgi:hypothetical protein